VNIFIIGHLGVGELFIITLMLILIVGDGIFNMGGGRQFIMQC